MPRPRAKGLTINEMALGPDHPDVAEDLGDLAAVHFAQRQFAQAEPHKRRGYKLQNWFLESGR